MTTIKENIDQVFPTFTDGLDSVGPFVTQLYSILSDKTVIVEIGIVACLTFIARFMQKRIQSAYQAYLLREEKAGLTQKLLSGAINFSTPLIAFVMLSLAMSLSAGFTGKLEVYKLSIKLTFIWLIWSVAVRSISDLFVRWVVSVTLIPFLVFSAFSLSTPVLNYLDSIGFFIGTIHVTIFLILKALLIATCLFWFARFICKAGISFIENQKKINLEIRDLLENLFQVVLYTAVILITLDLVGIDLKSLAIIGGAVGIGIGLGLQKIAANFISGIIILFEQNVKVGHLVEIAGGGNPGWIRHLGARAAVIDTGDGKNLLIPNEDLLTKTLIAWTYQDKKVRTDLQIKVSFHSNLEKAKEIMLETVMAHPFCSKNDAPTCFLEKFTDHGAQFLLQFWVDDLSVGKMDMQNDVLLMIWRRFAEEGIEFPKIPMNVTA